MTVLSACFYVKSIPDVVVNMPPRFEIPASFQDPATQDEPVVVMPSQGRATLSVVVTDPDGDLVSCFWPDLANVQHTEEVFDPGNSRVCSATILDLEAVRDRDIRIFLFETGNDAPISRVFQVVVP